MASAVPMSGNRVPAPAREVRGNRRRGGNNIIEFALLIPWYVFLFVGVYDYGFYSYSLIAVQSAARVSAVYASSSASAETDSTSACSYALGQLQSLPNLGSSAACTAGSTAVTSSAPLAVQAQALAQGPDLLPAAQVTVTYLTPQLIPIPGLLPGQLTITRTVRMRLRG